MFPLGNVLLPRALMALHVFEPRYLQLMEDIDEDGEFGIVLIERGSEVGGGDARFSVGTVAQILHRSELDGGRLAIVVIGTQRVRVDRWLEDAPYPQAIVSPIVETVANGHDDVPGPALGDLISRVAALRTRIYGLAAEAGVNVGDTSLELSADPAAATWQLCAQSPVGVLDRQRLLTLDDPAHRLRLLLDMMADEARILEAQLAAG